MRRYDMNIKEIEGEHENQLIEFIGVYGENYLIMYIANNALEKDLIIKENS